MRILFLHAVTLPLVYLSIRAHSLDMSDSVNSTEPFSIQDINNSTIAQHLSHRASFLTPFHKFIILLLVYLILAAALFLICCWHVRAKDSGIGNHNYISINDNSRPNTPEKIHRNIKKSSHHRHSFSNESSSSSEDEPDKRKKSNHDMERGIAMQDYHENASHRPMTPSASAKKQKIPKLLRSSRSDSATTIRPPLHPMSTIPSPYQFGPPDSSVVLKDMKSVSIQSEESNEINGNILF